MPNDPQFTEITTTVPGQQFLTPKHSFVVWRCEKCGRFHDRYWPENGCEWCRGDAIAKRLGLDRVKTEDDVRNDALVDALEEIERLKSVIRTHADLFAARASRCRHRVESPCVEGGKDHFRGRAQAYEIAAATLRAYL